jgi:hypothetical protein
MISSRNISFIFIFLSSFSLLLEDHFTLGLNLLQGTNVKKPSNNVKSFGTTGELLAVASTTRRKALLSIAGFASSTMVVVGSQQQQEPQAAWARAPGSKNIAEAVDQIRDASEALRQLQRDWEKYALIDKEGRAVTDATVLARRILGGVGPMAGDGAIEMAKATPLYRIDGAFTAVRKASLDDEDDSDSSSSSWAANLDLELFDEIAERIVFQVQKADGDLYSVQFASKGTTQISGIYKEAKGQVDQGVVDVTTMLGLLKDAGAPGF